MITATDSFKAHWQRKTGQQEILRIQYKLRYWTGVAYALQANWTTLEKGDFISVGRVPLQLDVPNQSTFLSSVLTLRFDNTRNQWIEHAGSPSIFAADAESGNGYILERSQFRIQYGYLLDSGTEEVLNQFTGLASGKFKITGNGAEAEVEVISKDILLKNADAENVSTDVTLENCIPATGDGANTAFESTSTGVGYATDVQVNAVALVQGTGYSTSNENQVVAAGNTGRLAITVDAIPAAGQTVKVSLRKWLTNKTIEYLLGVLLDEAGIPSTERTIDPIVYPGGVSSSHTFDSQADFEDVSNGGSLVNISTTDSPGSISRSIKLFDDFSDGDYTADPTWTKSTGSATVTGGKLRLDDDPIGGVSAFLYTPQPVAYGTWQFKIVNPVGQELRVGFIAAGSGDNGAGESTSSSYYLTVTSTAFVFLTNSVLIDFTVEKTVRITRATNGEFKIYVDGVLKLTVTDNSLTSSSFMYLSNFDTDLGGDQTIDDIIASNVVVAIADAITNATSIAVYVVDLLSVPVAMGQLVQTTTFNGGTVSYRTAGAVDAAGSPGAFDALVAVTAGSLQMNHTAKQWLKVEITITPNGFTSPVINTLVAHFSSSNVVLALANFSQKKVSEAEEMLVHLSDYERVINGSGNYLFRSKTVSGSPAITLTQENGIIDVIDYDTGIPSRVVNVGRVKSGGFLAIYDKTDAAEAEPTSERRHGRIVQDEDFDEIMLSNDADLRTVRAQSIYERNVIPPLWLRLQVWIIPWLELSDIVRVSYFDNPILQAAYASDPMASVLGPGFTLGEPGNVIARDRDFKVIEYIADYDTNQAELLLEAI